MRRLALRALSIFALRWLRGWGYRGRHPGVIYGFALALLAAASIGAAAWTHAQFQGFDQLPAQLRPPVVAVIILFLFISGGLLMLLTESIRLSGSRLEAVLGTLPLTTREIRLFLWLPAFTASLAMQLLLFVPAVSAFSALRFPIDQSLLAALLGLVSGFGFAALVVALVRRTLGAGHWASVQYPVMLLAWMALCGVEVWQTISDLAGGNAQLSRALLLVPFLAREAGRGRLASWQAGAIIVGVVAISAALLWWGGRATVVGYPRVAWRWSSRWKPPLMTLELTRMLRSTYLVANLIGGEIVSLGLALALWKLPLAVRPYLFVALVSTMMLFCALPLLLVRGLTRAKWPQALVLGYGAIEWTTAQIAVSIGLALVLAATPLLVSAWLLGSAGVILQLGLPLLALSCGVAVYVGWLTPTGADDPLGQALGTFSIFVGIQLLELVLDHVFHARTAFWTLSLLLIGGLGIVGAVLVEQRRWNQLTVSTRHA